MKEEKVWHQSVAKSVAVVVKEKAYKEPELKHYNFNLSRRWYVIFYAHDPAKGELVRVRLFHPINKFKTVHERLQVANQMMDVIRKDLRAGKTLTGATTSVGGDISGIQKMSVLEAIDFVRKQKEFTNHRANYTRDFTKVHSNWKKFLFHRNGLTPSSEQEEEAALRKADIAIRNLTQSHVYDFFSYLNQVKKISNKTYNNYKATFSIVINYLMKRDPKLFKVSPMQVIDVLPVVAKKHAAFTNEQMEAIKKGCLDTGNEQLLLFIQFMYYTLARPAEIVGLKVQDIDLSRSRIFIPGEISKTKFDEYVGLPERLAVVLLDSNVLSFPGEYFIFGEGGRPNVNAIDSRHFYNKNDKLLKSIKLKSLNRGYTLYSYKHSGAISLYQSTKDIALVQRQCRHKELSETSKYLRDLGLIDGFEGVKHWDGAI